MSRHQNLYGLNKHCPKKIHKASCTICNIEKITTINKGTTVDSSNLQPGERFHMDFAFYNVTSVCCFTSMLTLVCEKTRMLWALPTSSKIFHVRIICFIMTTLMNKQHPYKRVRVDKDRNYLSVFYILTKMGECCIS